jgi:hypothetical protein
MMVDGSAARVVIGPIAGTWDDDRYGGQARANVVRQNLCSQCLESCDHLVQTCRVKLSTPVTVNDLQVHERFRVAIVVALECYLDATWFSTTCERDGVDHAAM